MTWKTGVVDRSRSGSTSSAIRSKGVPWWSKAASTAVRLSARKRRNGVPGRQAARSARVL
ncbi:hypothetical protein T45_05485 [Streptomyces turgidiscabies]|nr:hypothetical protein T45_05485 [Streptomyces turgidiscabies]